MKNNRKFTFRSRLILLLGFYLSCGIISCISSPPPKEEDTPSWSPNGQLLAYECYVDGPTEKTLEGNGYRYTEKAADICVINADGTGRIHLIKDSGGDHYPVWSPDGSKIAYIRRDGIYVVNANGSNQHHLVQLSLGKEILVNINKVTWSPDGKQLMFAGCLNENVAQNNIYLVDSSTGKLTNLTQGNKRQNYEPRWVLNGTAIVFLSTSAPLRSGTCFLAEHGRPIYQIRVINVDGSGERVVYDGKTEPELGISVSDAGRVAFTGKSTNLEAKSKGTSIYTIGLNDTQPVELDQWARRPNFSPNGKWILYEGGGLRIIDIETKKVIHEFPLTHNSIDVYSIANLAWSPDSQQIVLVARERKADLQTGFYYQEKHIYIFDLQSGTFRSLAQK